MPDNIETIVALIFLSLVAARLAGIAIGVATEIEGARLPQED